MFLKKIITCILLLIILNTCVLRKIIINMKDSLLTTAIVGEYQREMSVSLLKSFSHILLLLRTSTTRVIITKDVH